ncbi:hypothetical protein FCH28_05345 [Streptomyces piniterrae]|uniref:Uncharacterized protein n=1 Tax=Streptomyces piniterrae TaxID=2571125 RepID=A0A4U0NR83_9ACTN|nr:hypothetical protein [Streptomyces piniterrae]TJZ56920.1 hypothetical protein FCH28_05345 [Streptomyces piniterrae]
MRDDGDRQQRERLSLLLGLVDAAQAERVRDRLGLAADDGAEREVPLSEVRGVLNRWSAHSFMLWMLECDDPDINREVYASEPATAAIRRDILRGVPFGPHPGPVAVHESIAGDEPPHIPLADSPHGVVGELRRARRMSQGRGAAMAVTRGDWEAVAAADRAEPLPGYARWNLAIRIDCPPALREQFGSHPKFRHRLRSAGIMAGPWDFVSRCRSPQRALEVLDVGRRAFPHRMPEALDVLRPLVRTELGGHPEAWAVFAQLLPTFDGTLPELVRTAGAIATAGV